MEDAGDAGDGRLGILNLVIGIGPVLFFVLASAWPNVAISWRPLTADHANGVCQAVSGNLGRYWVTVESQKLVLHT